MKQQRERFIRIEDVENITGLSRRTIYRLMKSKEFPQNIELTANSVGWLQSEIDNWIENRIQQRNNKDKAQC